MNKQKSLERLKVMQKNIVPESDEDEGAAEYWSEIESVISAIEKGLINWFEYLEACRNENWRKYE